MHPLRWIILAVALGVAALLLFRRRTGRPVVQTLVLLAFAGIVQAALSAPFPVDAALIVVAGAALLWMFADYFRSPS